MRFSPMILSTLVVGYALGAPMSSSKGESYSTTSHLPWLILQAAAGIRSLQPARDISPKTRSAELEPDENMVYSEYKASRSTETRATEAKDQDDEVLYTEYSPEGTKPVGDRQT
ncbi:hypothetical protein HO133_007187 [Letharia lupina]|uniref:Uncharacterized protein n=1 Tax=Letharia lupina TaxID=560253 RepID=A0A8H6FIC9_9LECA|nr:uncharacterized protein HO133_007187 [Letharia lupina]KAF6229073.1 hypothetical protein HO133_007187 [Letharia lupina]